MPILQVGGPVARKTAQATTSGTAFDFTGIPPNVRRIIVAFSGVSLDGTDQVIVQLGDAGGIETSGYLSSAWVAINGFDNFTITRTDSFVIDTSTATTVLDGIMEIVNINSNDWVALHAFGSNATATGYAGGGSKTLSATLTQVRITRTGTNNFDAGSINVLYM